MPLYCSITYLNKKKEIQISLKFKYQIYQLFPEMHVFWCDWALTRSLNTVSVKGRNLFVIFSYV